MGWFGKDTGEVAEGIGNGISKVTAGIRHMFTGDLPPETVEKLEELALELDKLESKMLQGQVELNKIEAQSPSFFKSAWRPAVGWIGVLGLAYQFLVHPVLEWYILLKGYTITVGDTVVPMTAPVLNSDGIMGLVTAMLGIGGYRTYEKFKGITN